MSAPEPVQRFGDANSCPVCGEPKPPERGWCSSACKARDWRETRARLGLPPRAEPVQPEERTRLRGQADRILARLRAGRATNAELARISLKYTGRISDLRARGERIEVVLRDRATGLTVYELRT